MTFQNSTVRRAVTPKNSAPRTPEQASPKSRGPIAAPAFLTALRSKNPAHNKGFPKPPAPRRPMPKTLLRASQEPLAPPPPISNIQWRDRPAPPNFQNPNDAHVRARFFSNPLIERHLSHYIPADPG